MSEDLCNDVEIMSLSSKVSNKTAPRPAYENERWMYGYHLKTRHVRKLAEKCGLPWKEDPIGCLLHVQDHILHTCDDLDFGWKYISYRDEAATIITFVEDDGRKRLEKNKFSKEDMERVRRVMGLPKGTRPRWYNRADRYDDDAEFSSDDEPFPEVKVWPRVPTDEDVFWDEVDDGSAPFFNFEDAEAMDDSSKESDDDMEENIVGKDQA